MAGCNNIRRRIAIEERKLRRKPSAERHSIHVEVSNVIPYALSYCDGCIEDGEVGWLVGWLALFEVWCKEVASEIVSGKCLLGGYAVRTPCLGISMEAGRHALWM